MTGIGDFIERVLKFFGIDRLFKKKDCGCKKRKRKLNKRISFNSNERSFYDNHLRMISTLSDNWNGRGAKRIEKKKIDKARGILYKFGEEEFKLLNKIIPTNESNILFYFSSNDNSSELEMYFCDGIIKFFYSKDDKLTKEENVSFYKKNIFEEYIDYYVFQMKNT